MDPQTLESAKAVMAKREEAIFSSPNPKQAAVEYLTEVGYLNADGSVSERYSGGIPNSRKAATTKRARLAL